MYCLPLANAIGQHNDRDSLRERTLGTVHVHGRQMQTLRAGLPVQIIGEKQMGTLNVSNLSDVVSHFSGVTIKDYGGIGGQKTVSLRGLGAQFTGISFDGFVSNNIQSGQIDLGKHSLDNIAQVSLTNGQPNDVFLTARSFASGGLIEIKTKMPEANNLSNEKNNQIRLKAGSFGMMNPGAFLMGMVGNKLSYNFDLNAVNAHGRYKFLQNHGTNSSHLVKELTRENAAIQSLRTELNLKYAFNKNESLFFKTNFFYSDRELPGSVVYYLVTPSLQELKDRNINVGLNYSKKNSERFEHKYYLNYSNAMNHYTDNDTKYTNEPLSDRYLQEEFYFSAVGKYNIKQNWLAVASADWYYNTLDLVSNVNYRDFVHPTRHTALLNVATKYFDEHWTFGANVLLTQTFEATRIGAAAQNKQKLTPSANVSYKPFDDKELRLRAFYKNIYRLPTFNDLYYQKMGNNNLRPENSNQFNLGFTYLENNVKWFDQISIITDVYYNNVKDKIIAMPRDMFHWGMMNKGIVEIIGLDLKLGFDKKISQYSALGLTVNYTFQHAVDKTPNSVNYNEQIPYTPWNSGSGALTYGYKNIEIGYNIHFSGSRYIGQVTDSKNYMAPYFVNSANVGYKYKNWKLNAELINLFNVQYEIVKFYPMPRRNYRIALQYKF